MPSGDDALPQYKTEAPPWRSFPFGRAISFPHSWRLDNRSHNGANRNAGKVCYCTLEVMQSGGDGDPITVSGN